MLAQDRRPPHRVLLVREWDQQASSSGCCGRLNTATVQTLRACEETPYAHTRADMERVGEVYRALRRRFAAESLDITVVDPRNAIWLLPAVWRDARRRGLSVRSTLRQLRGAGAACVLVCDGVVLAQDATPDRAVALVEADLSGR